MASNPQPPNVPAPDAAIIQASWSVPERFAEVFERHFAGIHRYIARRVGTSLADDLASEVFKIAFERRRRFDLGVDTARPWLLGIATNLIRNNHRSELRQLRAVQRLGDDYLATTGSELEDAQEAAEMSVELARMARAIEMLNSDQRDALLLHYWAGLTHSEIAASLHVSPGTVASRLARARLRLQSALAVPRRHRPTGLLKALLRVNA